MKILLIALFLILPVQAFAMCDNWSTADWWREGTYQVLTVADWGQTLNFTQHGERCSTDANGGRTCNTSFETNPILGKNPSRDKINTLIPLGMIAHALASCWLTGEWRTTFQGITIGIEAQAVSYNASVGIDISF